MDRDGGLDRAIVSASLHFNIRNLKINVKSERPQNPQGRASKIHKIILATVYNRPHLNRPFRVALLIVSKSDQILFQGQHPSCCLDRVNSILHQNKCLLIKIFSDRNNGEMANNNINPYDDKVMDFLNFGSCRPNEQNTHLTRCLFIATY